MIPVSEPWLGQKELDYVSEAVRTGWISSAGKFITDFEEKWAAYCGRRYGVSVTNGTAALEAAVAALDLTPGEEVILPSFTIISCAQAVTNQGGIPVLVDSDPVTWGMDVSQVAARITPRTRALMPVHIYGHPVDMDPLLALAEKHHLAIIEDAAEVHGAQYLRGRNSAQPEWRRCGSFGTLSTFSFYANKLITCGEGGMVLTDDPHLAERLISLRNLCFIPGHRFYHEELGYNFRLTNMQAALGLAQLEKIEEILARRAHIGAEYDRHLQGIKCLQLPARTTWGTNVYWVYGIVLSEETGLNALDFAKRLKERGVDTRPFFLGMHEQPVFQKQGLFQGESYPVAERLARQGLYLPTGTGLSDAAIQQVSRAVRESLL